MKEQIDIEHLLDWAYRVQCVDKQVSVLKPRGPSSSASGSLGQYAELGTKVDNSGAALKALGMKVADDAMIVHDAVLSAGEMWIEWKRDDEVEIWDRERATAAGQEIGKHDGQWLRRPITPNGRVAAFGIRLEQAATVALLITNAKNATGPDWHEGWSAPEGRAANDSLPVDRRGRLRKRTEAASVEEVMHGRAIYAVWRAALALVAIDLAGALRRYDVIGPAAPEHPWLKAPKRVLDSLRCQNSNDGNALKLQAKK
jgi:hypothetical protein